MLATSPTLPIIPDTAPFTPEQRAWLNGFIAGVLAKAPMSAAAVPTAETLSPLTILFGSQTGTAENLAKRAAKRAGQRGFAATIVDMAQTGLPLLARETNLLVISSTHGDGEPPDNARALHGSLRGPGAPSLAGVRFSVCGLGDTNYVRFCQAAKDFDDGLEKLGARRVAPRVDCDLDYEAAFGAWLEAALGLFGSPAGGAPAESRSRESEHAEPAGISRKNPFIAPLIASRTLNAPGSSKQVQHVEFSLADSGLAYEAGDALGVWPQNCPELVTEILGRLGCDGEEAVSLQDGLSTSFRRALTSHLDLGKPSLELAARFAAPPQASCPSSESPAGLHVIDLLAARPETRLSAPELVRMLRPLAPRLYSISSSPRAHAGQVHLTVASLRYDAHGRRRKGVCSTFLGDRVTPGGPGVGIYVHSNTSFRLPANGDTPIIMVGPGTGIAPFRAFLHDRRAAGAKGRAWLFFGDQHAATDFLYREELDGLQKDGVLTRIHTAFSRDQLDKVYVQDRMREASSELYAWLEEGAHLYVCGDASRMAKDVEQMLVRIIAREGRKTDPQAMDYVQGLRAAKRYCRDVY
jgi:sulfite reductase (NADPH) flavoprotein alpha-component